eukprot:scaffold30544_cov49-Phaeocystis_antarctica.AAC.4
MPPEVRVLVRVRVLVGVRHEEGRLPLGAGLEDERLGLGCWLGLPPAWCRSSVGEVRVRVLVRVTSRLVQGHLPLGAGLEYEAEVGGVEEEGARLGVGEHLDQHVPGEGERRLYAEALADLAEDERRVVLEAEVAVPVRRRLGAPLAQEVALPLLLEVGRR